MRRRKRRLQGEVELNLASMLDMAFQLLAFFILTFRPAPAEGQLLLHLPPPEPIAKPLSGLPDGTAPSEEAVASEKTLEIRLTCDAAGKLASIGVGFGTAFAAGDDKSLAVLDQQLRSLFGQAASPYDRVMILAAPDLQYGELMKVVDVCARQRTADGRELRAINLSEFYGPSTAQ
jgi:biopolymer transport protein ExbD